jgi:hypothetical protein
VIIELLQSGKDLPHGINGLFREINREKEGFFGW